MVRTEDMTGNKPIFHCILRNRIFLAQNVPRPVGSFSFFDIEQFLQYTPVCNDLGPENISCVCRFVETLDKRMVAEIDKKIVCMIPKGKSSLTNSIFLLGAFLVLKFDVSPNEIWDAFESDPSINLKSDLEAYHDSNASDQNFNLSPLDCWQALQRAASFQWILFPSLADGRWGRLDVCEYAHYESMLNGDFVEVRTAFSSARLRTPTHFPSIQIGRGSLSENL